MEIINTEEFRKLLKLLDEAELLVSQFTGGYSNQFFSAEEFHAELAIVITRLKAGDMDVLSTLHYWFFPTCSWDDFTGMDGMDLGNKIYHLIGTIQKAID